MQTLTTGLNGIGTLIRLNWDRLIVAGTLVAALYAGAYIALI